MRSRLVRIQLIALVVVTVAGIVFVGGKYVRIDNLLGFGQYRVHAQFEDSGGISSNAEVTYRGVPVGSVGKMSLMHNGIEVELPGTAGRCSTPSPNSPRQSVGSAPISTRLLPNCAVTTPT